MQVTRSFHGESVNLLLPVGCIFGTNLGNSRFSLVLSKLVRVLKVPDKIYTYSQSKAGNQEFKCLNAHTSQISYMSHVSESS